MKSTLCESPKTMFFLQPTEKLIISGMMCFLSKKRSGKRGATNMNQQQTCEGLEEGVPASGSAPGSSSGWINMRYKSMIRNKNRMNYGRVRKPECVRPKENESEWFKISAMWNQESEKGFTGRKGLNINGVMRNHQMNLGIAKKILSLLIRGELMNPTSSFSGK